jgi:hypothetical protein
MTARVSEVIRGWLGWCPNAPHMRTAPAVLLVPPETIPAAQSDGGGHAGRPGRIRDGISIAVASLKALVQDRHLLGFALLSGFVMLFLVLAEAWNNRYIDPTYPVTVLIGDSSIYLDQQYRWIALPLGDSNFIFFLGLFLVELVCISGFIILLTGLIQYRSGIGGKPPFTVRDGLSVVRTSIGPLAALSVGMALLATIAYEIISRSEFLGSIISTIMNLFWLPYAYYEPPMGMGMGFFATLYASAYFFSLEIMAINILLFLAAMYLVPAFVLEKKGLVSSVAGSITLFRRTWREILGCILVFGLISLGIFAVGLLIGQFPALVNNDLDFFISRSRGYFPMMAVCYGFLVACWILMAAGFTAAGVAIADLYRIGKGDRASGIPEGNMIQPEPVL